MRVKGSIKFLALLGILLLANNSYAANAVKSMPINGDRRLRMWNYQPNTMYEYTGVTKAPSRIELDPTEEIASITMGDPTDWQINPVGSTLFLKPVAANANTNMTIITNKRTYYFEMYSKEGTGMDDPDMALLTKFNYVDAEGANGDSNSSDFIDLSSSATTGAPDYVPDPLQSTKGLNLGYSMSGSKDIAPLEAFDDGEFTYFKFKNINADYPAIFQVLPDGNEAIVNYRVSRNGYVVIEMVTSQYTLRFGSQMACIFNDSKPLPYVSRKIKKSNEASSYGIY